MSAITFFDLLGIDPSLSDSVAASRAAALWPDSVSATEGFNVSHDAPQIVAWLQHAVTFERVRPGADRDVQLGQSTDPGGGRAGQISLSADLRVDASVLPAPTLYLRDIPNVGIQLLSTGTDKFPTVFFASDGRGYEVLIENLPVDLLLPPGLIEPDDDTLAEDGSTSDFSVNNEDSVAIVKARDPAPSIVRTHVRLHLRPDGDVILEPNTPISIDGAKWSGFPVEALHDILLIPSPRRREYFEWARNDLSSFVDNPPAPGAIGIRAASLALDKPPFKSLVERFRDKSGVHSEHVDLVLEDVVIPVTGGVPFPIPSHGTFGLRRKITDRNDIAQAYSLQNAPFRVRVYTRGDATPGDDEGLYVFVDQLLFKTGSTRAHSDQAPVFELQSGVFWQGAKGSTVGGTVGIGDDWTIQAGFTLGDASALHLMTIADVDVRLHAVHAGLRLRTIGDGINAWQFLGDISLKSADSNAAFQVQSVTGKPLSVVLKDVGWSFGHVTLGKSAAMPEGAQLVFGKAGFALRLIAEELGWVEEPSGGTYFSFSGGVQLDWVGGKTSYPTSERDEQAGNHAGIRFRRLRFLTSDTPTASPWKLDGLFLDLKYHNVEIAGFGYFADEIAAGYRYRELGFGVKMQLPAFGETLSLAAEFLKGSRQSTTDAGDAFAYFLASLQIGYIPVGAVGLYDVRALFAYNMQPALDPPGQLGESMVLYQWHKDHDGAIDMPRSRNLSDWTPVDKSLAVGAAAGFSVNSCGALFHIGAFVLVTHSEVDTGVLVVGDVYLLKNPQPIAFLAASYDSEHGKFGAMAGVDFTLSKFVKEAEKLPKWLRDMARLSGTIYFGNEPWTLAIGQLADQRTWLGVTFKAPLAALTVRLAVGLQITDEGPKGFGVVFSISGGTDYGIGAFIVFGSFGLVIGTWKTGSDSTGADFTAKLGFKIHLFYVFHFGADISVDISYLGKHPRYALLSVQVHIDTPWFLPDVTFHFQLPIGESQPFETETITKALSAGSAASPTAPGSASTAVLLVPPLSDGNTNPAQLYTFNQLAVISGAALEDMHLRDDVPVVAVDADVCIQFTNPVANDAAIGTDTYVAGHDLGVQKVQNLTVRYALKSLSIQRSPRYGAGAGTWTDLVAAVDTELDVSGGGVVHATPAVSFRWDSDTRGDGVLSPTRLLINSRTPYSLTIGSSLNDQQALANDPGFPCCGQRKPPPIRWCKLDFTSLSPGLRLPASEQFSLSADWWHWTVPPATINGFATLTGTVVAFIPEATEGVVGSVDFATPVCSVQIRLDASASVGTWAFEAYRGLVLVEAQTIDASSNGTISLRAPVDAGLTRLVLRAHPPTTQAGVLAQVAPVAGMVAPLPASSSGPSLQGLQLAQVSYLECSEARIAIGRFVRCGTGGNPGTAVGGAGKLAFLPNHDYAVTATVEITLSHTSGGSRTLTLSQPAYFRTKGLVGLNSVANVGDELRPYVQATYPHNSTFRLYRSEPAALAFTEDMSNLLPVDRVPAPGDPPEKSQLMQLTLAIDRVASTEGVQRLTAPSQDWLTAHGGIVVPQGLPLIAEGFVRSVVRRGPSQDPRVIRYETVQSASGCVSGTPLHSSQVLVHEPVGPDGTPGAWEPQASLRATVRAQGAPFTERHGFVPFDLGAFTFLSETVAALQWTLVDGSVVGPAAGRAYAAFGDPTWNHLRVRARFDPAASTSGVAIGVSGTSPVAQAMLVLVQGNALVLVRRTSGADQEVARATPIRSDVPVDIEVTAFDDRVRARVGDVVVEADRGEVREGRVALVTEGAARFDTLLVDGLDLFAVGFSTSRYHSFTEHITSRETAVAAHSPDGMGAPPARTPAQVLTDDAAVIGQAMSFTADPQSRQGLFSRILSDIGLPQLESCDRVTLTRLADVGGTTAILLESPEPISFIHDAKLTLTRRTWHYVPPRFEPPNRNELLEQLTTPPPSGPQPQGPNPQSPQPALLASAVRPGPRNAGTTQGGDTSGGATGGGWVPGHWVEVDTPVTCTLIGNGDETSLLLIPAGTLLAGTYALALALDRTRWQSATSDPEATYHDEATIELSW
jgi:hypothetical protein